MSDLETSALGFNQGILDWQNSLPGFGISYDGPKNGLLNPQFISSMVSLENKYKAYGDIFTGSGVKMSVHEAQRKFLSKTDEIITKPSDEKEVTNMKVWESFLSQNLPVIGKVYDGDLSVAGKKLETAIGNSIGRSMTGIIWNDIKKQFNTTPDDIKKSLNLIQAQQQKEPKKAELTMDDRVYKMSLLFNK